ncbi:MAG: hypothetical protein E7663_03020 [Ruminococcaceae bacterium]|nr:hypothetical protein [Oscillospiraceae bacterium]
MDQNRFTPEFCSTAVAHFAKMTPEGLHTLAQELGLRLTAAGLSYCQRYFSEEEKRAPLVGELRFLDAYAARYRRSPETLEVKELSFQREEDARVFADILRMQGELQPVTETGEAKPPLLPELLAACGSYLCRGGRAPETPIEVAPRAMIAAHLKQKAAPDLFLDAEDLTAVPSTASATRTALDGMMLLTLVETQEGSLVPDAARLFSEFSAYGLLPLVKTDKEGLLPHLVSLSCGAELDLAYLRDADPTEGVIAALTAGKHVLLFAAPERALGTLFASGAPIALVGRALSPHRLVIRRGMQRLLSLSLDFLKSWRQPHSAPATVHPPLSSQAVLRTAENGSAFLGEVRAEGSPQEALSDLLCAALSAGADMRTATLSMIWECPESLGDTALLEGIIPLLIGVHRICAELALPSMPPRLISSGKDTHALRILLAASKCHTPTACDKLKAALKAHDFGTARKVLYQGNAH